MKLTQQFTVEWDSGIELTPTDLINLKKVTSAIAPANTCSAPDNNYWPESQKVNFPVYSQRSLEPRNQLALPPSPPTLTFLPPASTAAPTTAPRQFNSSPDYSFLAESVKNLNVQEHYDEPSSFKSKLKTSVDILKLKLLTCINFKNPIVRNGAAIFLLALLTGAAVGLIKNKDEVGVIETPTVQPSETVKTPVETTIEPEETQKNKAAGSYPSWPDGAPPPPLVGN